LFVVREDTEAAGADAAMSKRNVGIQVSMRPSDVNSLPLGELVRPRREAGTLEALALPYAFNMTSTIPMEQR
jgi:hypothetical protein